MKIVKTAYERFGAIPICLGRAGEKGVVKIEIDISSPLEEYPGAYFGIAAEAPDGTEYPVVCETEGKILQWIVNDSDTAKSGKGRAQVVMYGADGEIGRSKPVDTSVLPSIIANGKPPDPIQNWLDHVQNASGGKFAPVIEVTSEGEAISDAVGGGASFVVATLNPKLDNGTLAPNPEGGAFVPWSEGKLNVNGTEITAQIPGEPYIGSYDWVSGRTDIVGVSVVKSDELELTGAQGTTSQGVKYVRFRKTNSSALANAIASNRYEIIQDGQADKAIRLVASGQLYLYDNDIDLENPAAILMGLELLVPDNTSEVYYGEGNGIAINKGSNTITSDSGDVNVTYGVDTKTYIDNKFAELSAAMLEG